jgi:hypothetical protein
MFFRGADEEPLRVQRDVTKSFFLLDAALQENVVGKEGVTKRTIVWHFLDSFDNKSAEVAEAAKLGRDPATLGGMFVRSMQVDCITLWARARCPGWENRVPRAKIIVYWAA